MEERTRTVEISKKTLKNIFLGIAGCIILYWLLTETDRVKSVLQVVKNVVSPFLVGAALAFIINVPMRSFEKLLYKIKSLAVRRSIALTLSIIAVLLVLLKQNMVKYKKMYLKWPKNMVYQKTFMLSLF